MDIEKKEQEDWDDTELVAAVQAYLKMLAWEKNGERYNKALQNRLLRQGAIPGRTESSIEFRMQNISAVLVQMGRDRIKGYKPAKNVGTGVEQQIRNALRDSLK